MKSITIELTGAGASLSLVLPTGVSYAQAVVVTDDEVEIRVSPIVTSAASKLNPQPPEDRSKRTEADLDEILGRLRKLNPRKRITALNSIKAMFQFHNPPVNEDGASEILESLRKRGSLTIDEHGKLQFKGETALKPK